MQEQTDIHHKISILPQHLKSIVGDKKTNAISFDNLTLDNVKDAIKHTRRQTILSLLKPPIIQEEVQIQFKPIILVFCQPSQEVEIQTGKIYPYTPISYCSWLEGAGVRCIPLAYNINEGSMEFLLERAHGLLIPGGGANLYKDYSNKEGYGPVTIGFIKIWRHIQKLWAKGVHFAVWGTCLGLEIVLMVMTNDVKVLSNLNSRAHQLQIYSQYKNSQILKNMPIRLRLQVENKKLINFQHAHGISLKKFINYPKLKDKLKIISIAKDKDGRWFCAALEGKFNPLFLTQYHPQKQAYQWTKKGDIIHSKSAIQISYFLAERFVFECSKCLPSKTFKNQAEVQFYMIQQYRQIHTPLKMYKIYAIDYKFREETKKNRVQMNENNLNKLKLPQI